MTLAETFRTALDALRYRKMRSGLTVLGIVIGIAAVMLTVGLGQGAQNAVLAQINTLGSNLLVVIPGGGPQASNARAGGSASLTVSDVALLSDPNVAPDIASVAPISQSPKLLTAGAESHTATIVGSNAEWPLVRNREVEQGRFFTQAELDASARVGVIGKSTAAYLFGAEDPVGREVSVGGTNVTIIGLLETSGASMGQDEDDTLIVPRTTMVNSISATTNPNMVTAIYVQAKNEASLSAAYQQINNTLLVSHNVTEDNADFNIFTQQSLIDIANSTTAVLTTLLSSLAAISLIVGGIGVMNIMLVSVSERVREIGLRKALGATPAIIRRQFLVEASILGLLGGAGGITLGVVGAAILSSFLDITVTPSASAALVALGVSVIIGIGAGVYPASRAARLAPIDALRSE